MQLTEVVLFHSNTKINTCEFFRISGLKGAVQRGKNYCATSFTNIVYCTIFQFLALPSSMHFSRSTRVKSQLAILQCGRAVLAEIRNV